MVFGTVLLLLIFVAKELSIRLNKYLVNYWCILRILYISLCHSYYWSILVSTQHHSMRYLLFAFSINPTYGSLQRSSGQTHSFFSLFHQRVMRQWCTSIRHMRLWPGWAIPGLWQKFLLNHALLMELSVLTTDMLMILHVHKILLVTTFCVCSRAKVCNTA